MSDWRRTLAENVYIAKLAVLISCPKNWNTHWPPLEGDDKPREEIWIPCGLHGLLWSLASTAVAESLARSSSVIGMKAPSPHTTKTSAAKE
jgi:hypothetical protein